MSAAGVNRSTTSVQGVGPGSIPRAALHSAIPWGPRDITIRSIPARVAKEICVAHHYLGSYPGAAILNFGIFVGKHLLGVAVFGVGPPNVHRLFSGASNRQVLCLARFWLDDRLGNNSESYTLGVIFRFLKREQTTAKAVVAYSDPAVGHHGGIYQALGFAYVGRSQGTPLYRFPDGSVHHSRSLSQEYGTHSLRYFRSKGIQVTLVEQIPKHTYIKVIDPDWKAKLRLSVMPYPKKGDEL